MFPFLKVRNETLASDLPLSGSMTGPLGALELNMAAGNDHFYNVNS